MTDPNHGHRPASISCPSRAVRAPKIHGRDGPTRTATAQADVLDQIARYSPNFKDLIRHVEVRTPRELENEVGRHRGQHFQGRAHAGSAAVQPAVSGYAQYRGPVGGSIHVRLRHAPAAVVMAAPGANAAREILLDLRRPQLVPEGWQDD